MTILNGSIFKDALAFVADLAKGTVKRIESIEVADREFIVDQHDGHRYEVIPRFEDNRAKPESPTMRDLASISDWANACATLKGASSARFALTEPARFGAAEFGEALAPGDKSYEVAAGTIIRTTDAGDESGMVILGVAPDHYTEAVWPRVSRRGEVASRARQRFFDDYLPPAAMRNGFVSYETFLTWYDLVHDMVNDEGTREVLDEQLESVTATNANVTGIRQSGAVMSVNVKNEKNIATEKEVPKTFNATIPYGDPDCMVDVRFSLTMKLVGDNIAVRVQPNNLHEVTPKWVEWARAKLAGSLPQGWPVVVGAK